MPDGWKTHSLFHININVSNFERSIAFYEQLGFSLLRNHDGVEWPESTGTGIALPGAQGRACLMMLGDDPRTSTRLDLIEWTQPTSPPASPPQANALGVPRLALWTSNVQQAYEELLSAGVEFISEPIGGTPEHGVANMVCCRDPDGLLIELIEFLPGAGEAQSDH